MKGMFWLFVFVCLSLYAVVPVEGRAPLYQGVMEVNSTVAINSTNENSLDHNRLLLWTRRTTFRESGYSSSPKAARYEKFL